jgi:hypothetical protein
MNDPGEWLWFVIDVVLVAALGIGIAYGIIVSRRRRKNAATEAARDAATHRAYEPNEANRP